MIGASDRTIELSLTMVLAVMVLDDERKKYNLTQSLHLDLTAQLMIYCCYLHFQSKSSLFVDLILHYAFLFMISNLSTFLNPHTTLFHLMFAFLLP